MSRLHPSPRAILRAVGMLEAKARFKADIPEVFIRTGRDGDGETISVIFPAGCRTLFASLSTAAPSPAALCLPTTIESTYTDNRKEATITDLLDSPLGNVLLRVAHMFTGVSFTSANLHAALTEIAGKKVAAATGWPKTAATFSNELRRLAPQLRMHGSSVSFERRNEGRMIILKS